MPTVKLPIIKGDAQGKVGQGADYRDLLMVNMYAVPEPHLGANGYILTYPGLSEFGHGFAEDRGGVWNERFEDHYRISGVYMIQVSSDGETDQLGTVTGTRQASLAQSFNTQAVVSNGNYYLYDPENGFRQVVSENLGSPIDITWVDGYYFFTDGEYLFHTDIDDESSIDPLQYATAEFSPDKTLGVAKDKDNQVLVFGRYSIEYFFNRATEFFAFERISGKAQKRGIVGTHCKVELDGSFYYLGGAKEESPSVYLLGVGTSKKVATREVERIIEEYTEAEIAEDCVMDSRIDKGVKMLFINLPRHTLVLNVSVAEKLGLDSAWSMLKTDVVGDRTYRGINGVFDPRISKWVYGDKRDGSLGTLDEDDPKHYGDMVECLFYSPLVKMESMSIDKIELDTIPGFVDSRATVAISRTENGVIYSQEYYDLYSDPLAYNHRFITRALGYVSDRVGFKFRTTSGHRMAFCNLEVDYG